MSQGNDLILCHSPGKSLYLDSRQNKKWSHKKRPRDLCNTRREIQIQTKLDQPSEKNGQHQTSETTPLTKNLEEEEIMDAPENDGNASMPEQVKQLNP